MSSNVRFLRLSKGSYVESGLYKGCLFMAFGGVLLAFSCKASSANITIIVFYTWISIVSQFVRANGLYVNSCFWGTLVTCLDMVCPCTIICLPFVLFFVIILDHTHFDILSFCAQFLKMQYKLGVLVRHGVKFVYII